MSAGAPPTKPEIARSIADIIRTVDEHAREMNRRWGFNRLPHIVPLEWTERFRSQKFKWERACFECVGSHLPADLEAVRKHGDAMIRAYAKLDELALAGGMTPAAPGTWEFELKDGTPIVLVRNRDEMGNAGRPGAQVWCLEEIGEIIARFPELVLTKSAFPEAEVLQMRTSAETRDLVDDALESIPW
jgi:hypothetical protein